MTDFQDQIESERGKLKELLPAKDGLPELVQKNGVLVK